MQAQPGNDRPLKRRRLRGTVLTLLAISLPFWAAHRTPTAISTFVFPPSHRVAVLTASTAITAEYDTTRVHDIFVLRPFAAQRTLSIDQQIKKMGFARELYSMISNDMFLSEITMKSNKDSMGFRFPLSEQVNLRKLWASAELQRIWSAVHNPKATVAELGIRGWITSIFHTTPELRRRSGGLFSASVTLNPGLNSFQLMFLDSAQQVLMIDSLSVYYLATSMDNAPAGYDRHVFHSTPLEERCISCHTIASSCVTCHRGLMNLPSTHPVAEDCSLCHDLSSSRESKLLEGQEFNSEFCFTCHDDKKKLLETKTVVHGTATDCILCHDPHGSTFDTLVRDRTTNVCRNCHEDKASEPHPVANHPTEGLNDPYRPGKKLTCTSCHDPHASDFAGLFRFPSLPICQYCHGRK